MFSLQRSSFANVYKHYGKLNHLNLSNLNEGIGVACAGQVSSKAILLLTTILVRSSVLANLGAELPTGSSKENPSWRNVRRKKCRHDGCHFGSNTKR